MSTILEYGPESDPHFSVNDNYRNHPCCDHKHKTPRAAAKCYAQYLLDKYGAATGAPYRLTWSARATTAVGSLVATVVFWFGFFIGGVA